MEDHVSEFYRDIGGDWRWRLKHRNGRIIMATTEGYANAEDCFVAVDRSFRDHQTIRSGLNVAYRDRFNDSPRPMADPHD